MTDIEIFEEFKMWALNLKDKDPAEGMFRRAMVNRTFGLPDEKMSPLYLMYEAYRAVKISGDEA